MTAAFIFLSLLSDKSFDEGATNSIIVSCYNFLLTHQTEFTSRSFLLLISAVTGLMVLLFLCNSTISQSPFYQSHIATGTAKPFFLYIYRPSLFELVPFSGIYFRLNPLYD